MDSQGPLTATYPDTGRTCLHTVSRNRQMNPSSDILNLFKIFGGRPEQYQEVSKEKEQSDPRERWPGIAKAPRTEPEVGAPEADLIEGESLPAPAAVQPAAPETEAQADAPQWSSSGLQARLQQLNETPAVPAAVIAPAPAAPPRRRPDLSHIRVGAVVSAKGGVGKSTLSANLGAALKRLGHLVLLVDLDPQDALHHHFEQPESHQEISSRRGLASTALVDGPWRPLCLPTTSGVFVLPHGTMDESLRPTFEAHLDQDPYWLGRHLENLQLADGAVVILDTPPGPSAYLRQALAIAQLAIVTSLSDAASYTAMSMSDTLIRNYTKGRTDFRGSYYLINQVDRSRQLNKDIAQIMSNLLGDHLIGVIHRDQSVSEALAYNRTAIDYDPNGQGAHDILAVAQTLSAKLASDPAA